MRWLYCITASVGMSLSKLGDSEGQGSLVCCSPWGYKESDNDLVTEQKQQQSLHIWSLQWHFLKSATLFQGTLAFFHGSGARKLGTCIWVSKQGAGFKAVLTIRDRQVQSWHLHDLRICKSKK